MSDTESQSQPISGERSHNTPTILSVLATMTEDQKKKRLIQWAEIKHFTPEEFDSSDLPGSGILMNLEFVKILDQMRDKCRFPFHVNSGIRSEAVNAEVGGVDSSEHTDGNGADIRAETGGEKFALVKSALDLGIKRIGVGKRFIHVGMSFKHPQSVVWTYS